MVKKSPQLYLFTGENTFALAEELRRWKETFLAKHGEANLQIFDADALTWSAFCDEAKSAPFVSDKRLLIVEGIPPITKEELEELKENMHESTILVFSESAPDKRKSAVKFLFKEATVRLFPLLSKEKLVPWVLSLAQARGVAMESAVAAHLVQRVGTDQWCLRQECLKVIAFAGPHPPTISDVDAVALPSATHAVWVLNDLIGKGKTEEAALYGAKLWGAGEDPFSLWNLALYIVRNIATLWLFVQEKNLPAPVLARESGVNFLSVQSLLPFVRSLGAESVQRIVEGAIHADRAVKSGEIRATAQDSIELVTLLERQLLAMGN